MTQALTIHRVLEFWFGEDYNTVDPKPQAKWFTKDDSFDQMLRERFITLYNKAAAGNLENWTETAEGCLALTLILDQFPRNMFRNSVQSFATENRALAVAQLALDLGFDQELPPVMRAFFYLPFEHSENLQNQEQAVRLFATLAEQSDLKNYYEFALKHCEIIAHFGRFPHRNQLLGRPSTPEEIEFLQQPGSGF